MWEISERYRKIASGYGGAAPNSPHRLNLPLLIDNSLISIF